MGVGATRLSREGPTQGELFDRPDRQRHEALDRAIDGIRGAFGPEAIRRGSLVERPTHKADSDPPS